MKDTAVGIIIVLFLILSSCQGAAGETGRTSPSPSTIATLTNTVLEPTLKQDTPTISPEPSVTAELPSKEICSPLEGYSVADLEKTIVNPYFPPPPGADRPHQGVDLAVLDQVTNAAVSGTLVRAILSGEVKMVINNRFPYGNAILVETELGKAYELDEIYDPIPTAWTEVKADPALTCPEFEGTPSAVTQRSLYILYAHLEDTPTADIGSQIQCGEVLGRIGMSGNAINPHVHIEVRTGPRGAAFESMAHYESSATRVEMGTYCQWRVGGSFQHLDPMSLFQNLPDSVNR